MSAPDEKPDRGAAAVDLRRHPRIPWDCPARFRPTFQQHFVACRAVNVSAGGICFASDSHQSVGTEVAFEIDADGMPVRGTGVVRWARRSDDQNGHILFGIELSFVEPAGKIVVDRIIEQGLAPEAGPSRRSLLQRFAWWRA